LLLLQAQQGRIALRQQPQRLPVHRLRVPHTLLQRHCLQPQARRLALRRRRRSPGAGGVCLRGLNEGSGSQHPLLVPPHALPRLALPCPRRRERRFCSGELLGEARPLRAAAAQRGADLPRRDAATDGLRVAPLPQQRELLPQIQCLRLRQAPRAHRQG
jgi:hypothetical protein